jgi:SAM-dependent methyltransferase
MTASDAAALLHWTDAAGAPQQAAWRSERGVAPPKRVVLADDTLPADVAYRLACEGTGLLWQGDFQNARHLLQALVRRCDRPVPQRKQRAAREAAPPAFPEAFHRHRMAQAQRARILGALLIPFEPGWHIPLRRAPEVAEACSEAWGDTAGPAVTSLRELLGAISAHEWQRQGVVIPALARLAPPGTAPEAAGRLQPHYGVFSPVRGEYIDLVAQAPWPGGRAPRLAVDVGTGTGVLAAVLARRGAERVQATDLDPRALACAAANLERLGVSGRVALVKADLFPPAEAAGPERAEVIVCNPPWLPGRPSSPLERAVYDEGSRMLIGYLNGLAERLAPGGEGWLILSDLAEHLALRPREELLGWIARAGLQVVGRLDARPRHPKAADASDPLHAARSKEVTSLWRLAPLAAPAATGG